MTATTDPKVLAEQLAEALNPPDDAGLISRDSLAYCRHQDEARILPILAPVLAEAEQDRAEWQRMYEDRGKDLVASEERATKAEAERERVTKLRGEDEVAAKRCLARRDEALDTARAELAAAQRARDAYFEAMCRLGNRVAAAEADLAAAQGLIGEALDLVRDLKVRIIYIGMPQEPHFNPSDHFTRTIPDWRRELAAIDAFLARLDAAPAESAAKPTEGETPLPCGKEDCAECDENK